jgi:hypothetical protein
MSEEYSIEDLTPPALMDIVSRLGGGMVQSIIIGTEIVTADGDRQTLFAWDFESSIANQIGLARLLTLGLDERAASSWSTMEEESG